jgi:hypothetical protein
MSPIHDGPASHQDRFAAGDDVARLLRLAGPRPAVADDGAAREAARAEWRRQVWAHRRRKTFVQAGGWLAAAVVVMVVGAVLWQWLQVTPAATLAARTGGVTMVPAPGAGDALRPGSLVETADGRVALRMASGHSVRLDADTRARLVSGSALALERGAAYVDSGPAGAAGSFEVRTPLGVARDVGTQFEVRLVQGDGLLVQVREGSVELRRDGASHTAAAGTELRMDADGTLTRAAVARYGAPWDWVLEIAPGFDAAGRSLADLLDWAAREGGWELRFADDALAALAAETELHAPLAGLTPRQAVAVMVRGSNLTYRLEEGALLIERP